jgi:hypothetical protein
VSAQAQATPEPQAEENAALAVPATAASVCEARTTSVHFGARGSTLSRENQNAIEYAADAASVCDLQTVTVTDSAEGRISSRRAEAVRATLVRQGIPADRISVAQEANADAEAASTGRLDVRMEFAGVAGGDSPAAPATPAPEPTPAITPDIVPPVAPEGGQSGEEDTTPST